MGIVIGDIVTRESHTAHLSGSMPVHLLFYDGYFIVIDIMKTSLIDPTSSKNKEIIICKIMNSSGEMSWISTRFINKLV
jgi:hypothetical protein